MASTATFQQPFHGAGALDGSRPDWPPFGFTQFYTPPTPALGLGLEMANGVKQNPNFQNPMNTLMPLVGNFNGSFRLPDSSGFTANQQPPPPGSSTSSQSIKLQAISPNLLRTGHERSTTELPASPLQSVSGDELSESESELNRVIGVKNRRAKSDGDLGLGLVNADTDLVSQSSEGDDGLRTSKGLLQLEWPSGSDMRRHEREVKERMAEKRKEMVEFGHGPTKGNKRERRRMQNRLAQRVFRARSKIQNKEVVNHMSHLEALTEAQAERLGTLAELGDRLQQENTLLKQAQWSSAFGDRTGYEQHSGSETNKLTAQVTPNITLVNGAEVAEAGRH